MLLALLSDIHDHTTHLLLALQAAQEHGCTHLLFMGDMASVSTFRTLREEWPHPIDLVLGNNEYEIDTFQRLSTLWPHTRFHGTHADIVLNGRHLFFCHLPWTASQAAASGRYDAVFYGHTHIPDQQMSGHTLLANPGEVCGRHGSPTMGLYNTTDNSFRLLTI